MSQFAFLAAEFPAVHEHAARAENLAHADPRRPASMRLALEVMVDGSIATMATPTRPLPGRFAARIHEPTFQKLVGPPLVAKARIVKDLGTGRSTRRTPCRLRRLSPRFASCFIHYWLARTYGRSARARRHARVLARRPAAHIVDRRRQACPAAGDRAPIRGDRQGARGGGKAARCIARPSARKLDAEIKALQARSPPPRRPNAEAPRYARLRRSQTRDPFIDLLLEEAGWRSTSRQDREVPGHRHAEQAGRGLRRLRAVGRRRQAARRSSRPSAPEATRASASSRPSSTPTAWRRSSASGR